ncbi:MAG: 6-phosphogluconolactonase [Actinomycetota bacterium]|nr:6-phosphogluconolactonase [Actinomycetota bacterium]
MSFAVRVFPSGSYAADTAALIAERLPAAGSFVVTGGTSAADVYSALDVDLSEIEVFFSDERCVPPNDEASNFKMATETLLARSAASRVHRMRGEDSPKPAAASYHEQLVPAVRERFDLMLLGMGDDNHIAALFPNSPALLEADALCVAVDRPDGLKGLTMTPPSIIAAKAVLLVVSGESKAEAVARALDGDEGVMNHPVRLLVGHPDVTFVLDEAAASLIDRTRGPTGT